MIVESPCKFLCDAEDVAIATAYFHTRLMLQEVLSDGKKYIDIKYLLKLMTEFYEDELKNISITDTDDKKRG